MEKEEPRESLQVEPRYLCLCVEEGRDRFYFSPVSEVLGNALRRSPRILNRMIESTGRYKKLQAEERSYEPKFPWPEDLLKIENSVLPHILREGIKKKEGTYILFDSEPHEAIPQIEIKGNVLTAKVRSRSAKKPYVVVIRDAFIDETGNQHLVELYCPCLGYTYDLEKGGRNIRGSTECVHLGSVINEFQERIYLHPPWKKPMKQKEVPNKPVLTPFGFTSNWVYRNGMYQPKDRHLAALEGDVLITYYIIGGKDDDMFGINERLFTIEECYSPLMLEWIRSGKATRRVIGQRRKTGRMSREKWLDDQQIAADLDANIRAHGYEYDGMSREFGHVSRRYTNADTGNFVGVVFRSLEEPFYVVREPLHGSVTKPAGEQPKIADPLKLVGKRNLVTFDDVTMKETRTRIEMPSVLRLPECGTIDMRLHKKTRRRFRDALREAHGGEVVGIEKYAKVHYAD